MQIITGSNIDLITPFPLAETKRVFGWNHCFYTFSKNDDVPQEQQEFTEYIQQILTIYPSFGIIDKHQLTNTKHEAPLVGLVIFEPASSRQSYLHFATARKAFKLGLVDEAVELAVTTMFQSNTNLYRLGAYLDEFKGPVKYLLKRIGFQFEGVCKDIVSQGGELKNLIYYGLLKRDWLIRQPGEFVDSVELNIEASLAPESAQVAIAEDNVTIVGA